MNLQQTMVTYSRESVYLFHHVVNKGSANPNQNPYLFLASK